MKFCKDCRHYKANSWHEECQKPEFAEINIVTGELRMLACWVNRAYYGACKTEAIGWEPKAAIMESDGGPFCKKCGSSLRKKWFIRTSKCINPQCENYEYRKLYLQAKKDLENKA